MVTLPQIDDIHPILATNVEKSRIVTIRATTRSDNARLQTELLLIIFKMVYDMCRHEYSLLEFYSMMEWNLEGDSFSPSRFPHALASVCSKWRDVMVDVPKFWTRIAINIDRTPTELSVIQAHMIRSANCALDIIITRRDDFSGPDAFEQDRVAAVFKLLCPHVSHWQLLHVDVIHSDSLPSLNVDISGCAGLLRDLKFDCRDGFREERIHDLTPQKFECPSLKILHLDGPTFRDSCLRSLWPHSVNGLEDLTISHYTTDNPSISLFEVVQLVRLFPHLERLCFVDVELDVSENPLPVLIFTMPYLEQLYFEGIKADVIMSLSEAIPIIDSVDLVRCPITDLTNISDARSLRLQDIGADENPLPLLSSWGGDAFSTLTIDNCPCFDSAALANMAQCVDSSGRWVCPNLVELNIYNCANVSSKDLRKMVEARRSAAASVNDEVYVAIIKDIYVRGGDICDDDRAWVEDNVAWYP